LEEIEERLSAMAGLPYDDSRSRKQKAVDLDILFYADQVINTSKLHIPHKNIYKRAYALVPMLEIAPDLVHPAFNKTVLQLHEALVEPEEVYLYGTRDHELDFE
jgi:2-amino-4-hydroxy-6-hydroxymethyldihydropteridine diphosphokinase